MATSPAQVANLALGAIGQRQLIDALTEDSPEAEAVQVYFEQARLELLASWGWRFATRRQVLALTTEERTDWCYCYAEPADCLVARGIWNGRAPDTKIPFTKELNDAADGFLILTDEPEAELIYTASAPAVGLWPPYFVRAMALHLAGYLASMLPVKPELGAALEKRAALALNIAQRMDAGEAQGDVEPDSETIRVR
jgi:hypothetical protein